jgi:hypothetical protein
MLLTIILLLLNFRRKTQLLINNIYILLDLRVLVFCVVIFGYGIIFIIKLSIEIYFEVILLWMLVIFLI